jgi:GNAT superfamily N-acetyltransferase
MISIRKALEEDATFLLEMIHGLAEYEKAPEQVTLSLDQLTKDGFSNDRFFKSIILEINNKKVGMAIYYNRYSTWKGKSLYLEDLYVIPEFRGRGLGLKTMKYLAQEAVKTGCKRFEWQVLDWNEPSIQFYKKLNTDLDGEWVNCRLEGESLAALSNH